MMEYKIICNLMGILLFLTSCDHEKVSVLEGCCGNAALDEDIGNGHVYLPNIFTPNFDGINDRLIIFGDSLNRILKMEIKDIGGRVVYDTSDILPNDFYTGWNGKVDSVVKKGLYTVSLEIEAKDGTIGNFESKVCNFPCGDMDMEEKISGTHCQFPAQNTYGHYDSSLASYEQTDCYE